MHSGRRDNALTREVRPIHSLQSYERFAGAFFAAVFFAGTAVPSLGGDTKAMTDSPSSRVSAVVNMLGDFIAFWASFLILVDVIAAGALGIVQFYVPIPRPQRQPVNTSVTVSDNAVFGEQCLLVLISIPNKR